MNIKIITSQTCAFCKMIKQYLTIKGLTYTEEDTTHYSYDKLREIEKKYGTARVPITVFPDGSHINGYNIQKLSIKVNELTKQFANQELIKL